MTPNHTHEYTLALAPTPKQHAQLQHLSWVSGLVRVLAHDQATALADGTSISVAGMLDATQDRPACTLEAEALALRNVAEMRGAPHGLLVDAIRAGRADHAAGRSPRRIDTPHSAIAGTGLITPASAQSVMIDGVTGEVSADIAQLPRWAAQLWFQAAGAALVLPPLDLAGACLSDATYIAPPEESGLSRWEMDVLCDWNAYPTWQLMRYAPDDEARITAPPRVTELMGW